jgi:uncharacterized protein YndB with AHSA1/START domain
MTTPRTFALQIERIFKAPREALFRAWTTPELLKQWLHPDPSWSTPIADVDLRVGGSLRWGVRGPDGGTFYEVGEFLEITPPERLVYTCRYEHDEVDFEMPDDETIVRVTFEAVAGGTRVTLVQEGYTAESHRDGQRNGWPSFLDMLARLVEGTARGA